VLGVLVWQVWGLLTFDDVCVVRVRVEEGGGGCGNSVWRTSRVVQVLVPPHPAVLPLVRECRAMLAASSPRAPLFCVPVSPGSDVADGELLALVARVAVANDLHLLAEVPCRCASAVSLPPQLCTPTLTPWPLRLVSPKHLLSTPPTPPCLIHLLHPPLPFPTPAPAPRGPTRHRSAWSAPCACGAACPPAPRLLRT
jgi:hypothetical protein